MRLLVIEDEERVLSFLRKGFLAEGFSVDVASDGNAALDRGLSCEYDAIVLDLMLPGRSGMDVLRELRERGVKSPVLVLTARSSVEDRIAGLNCGADDYLVKPFAFDELMARVRALLRRSTSLASVVRVGDLTIDLVRRTVHRGDQWIDLTPKEFALLEYLARNAGSVVTRAMISQHVWGINFDTLSNVINVYIRYLRTKLDDPYPDKLIHTVRGVGYVLRSQQ